jgi:hypothetical protein
MERAVIGETSEVWICVHRGFDVALGVPLNGESVFGNLVAAITARAPELGYASRTNLALQTNDGLESALSPRRAAKRRIASRTSRCGNARSRAGYHRPDRRHARRIVPFAGRERAAHESSLRIFELPMRGVPYEAMRQNWLARFACDDGQGAAFERAWAEIHASAFLRALLPLGMQVTSVAI